MGDTGCMGFGKYHNNDFLAWQNGAWPNNTDGHNEGLNIGFFDGHAKWQKEHSLTENQFYPVPGLPGP